jgi:hypothetical protein
LAIGNIAGWVLFGGHRFFPPSAGCLDLREGQVFFEEAALLSSQTLKPAITTSAASTTVAILFVRIIEPF